MNSIIYDVGMHKGQDTGFYPAKGFKVVAIEANPILCKEAQKRFSEYIKKGQLEIVQTGIADEEKVMDFYINEINSEWSSLNKEIGSRGCELCKPIKIDCVRLSDIVKYYGNPYYIKIDIEGYDWYALNSLKNDNIYAKFISVENGNLMINTFKDMGYDSFKYVQQMNIEKTILPYPAKEGLYVDYTFESGASGPFGEETKGEWKNMDNVICDISKVWDAVTGEKNPNHVDYIDGWFDLHARHESHLNWNYKLFS